MTDFLAWVDQLPSILQFSLIFVVGVIPFLESYVGGLLGVLLGLPWPFALVAAVAGNAVALLVAVSAGTWVVERRERRQEKRERTQRQQKILDRVNKYGIPIASLIAPTLLAISLTAFIMVIAGLDKTKVLIWNIVAAAAWGATFTALGVGLFEVLSTT